MTTREYPTSNLRWRRAATKDKFAVFSTAPYSDPLRGNQGDAQWLVLEQLWDVDHIEYGSVVKRAQIWRAVPIDDSTTI